MSAPIRRFLSPSLSLNEAAEAKLQQLADLPDVHAVAVLPDVHAKPDNPFPTGTVVVTGQSLYPAAIGQDIGCGMAVWHGRLGGVRLSTENVSRLFQRLVATVGDGKPNRRRVSSRTLERMVCDGADWAIEEGMLTRDERARIERGGQFLDPEERRTARRAIPRDAWRGGLVKAGSLGGGNHFLELQRVEDILDADAANAVGLAQGDVLLWMHTGSSSLGKRLENYYTDRWDMSDPRRRWRQRWRRAAFHLEPARFDRFRTRWALVRGVDARTGLRAGSSEGRRYLSAHRAALNFAVANRVLLARMVQDALAALRIDCRLTLLLDVSHESIQQETLNGQPVWVHRNGASRALPPAVWTDPWQRGLGQWLPLPGSLGSASYLAVTLPGVSQSFWAVNHGAGRVLEKPDARRLLSGDHVQPYRAWVGQRIFYAGGGEDLAEQIPSAFKDIDDVARTVESHGLAKLVARCQPIASLKS